MDEIITHTINVTLPSLTNLTDLQKEFDALELPPAAREALLRSIVTEQTLSPVLDSPDCDPPVCDPPVCDPPVCDPPVCDPPEIDLVEPVVIVVEPTVEPAAPIVIPESLPSSVESVPQVEPSSRTSVGCCCQ